MTVSGIGCIRRVPGEGRRGHMFRVTSMLAAALCCITLLLAGPGMAQDPGPVRIGVALARTGPGTEENTFKFRVAGLAAARANSGGRVLGRPVELIEFDTRSTALGARQAALDAVKAGVVALVGPSWSSHAMVMGPVLQETGIPMIATTATAVGVTDIGDCIFRVCYTDEHQARALAQFAFEDLQARRVSVATIAGDVYSEGLSDAFISEFARLGGTVLGQSRYLQDSMDFTSEVAALVEEKPDVVLVAGYTRDSGLLLKQARSAGLTVPFLGGDGWTALERYPYLDPANGENFYASHWHQDAGTDAGREFLRLVRTELGEDALGLLDGGIANTYDAVGLVLDAVRRAGSASPAAIRDALAATEEYPGVMGGISFGSSRDPRKSLVILRITPDSVRFVRKVSPRP